MSDLHRIEDDLAAADETDELAAFALPFIAELESLLAKHAAFDHYLRATGQL